MTQKLLIEDYNYPLPDERIAKYPLQERDHSKLLIYNDGQVTESLFHKVGEYLPADSLLVYNNTRVIQARLVFHKETGARIEVFCLEPIAPHDYQLNLSSITGCTWKCMIGNLKKWKEGTLCLPLGEGLFLRAERLNTTGNTHEVRFTWDNSTLSFAEILEAMGELPIPPYLNRATEESDKTTYQTVYSRIQGSVAAPTAGLHFTDNVLDGLRQKGIETTEVTLHVGAGTFQPVKVEDANEHTMHTEIIAVPKATIQDIQRKLGHICAVGTTSMRTLESLYWIGTQLASQDDAMHHLTASETIHVAQFEPYEQEAKISAHKALQNILDYLEATKQDVLHAETQIMIRPGYHFRIVDILITNFHQPKSTLLLLVSAFVGGDWHTIYNYALTHAFRFLSYGDSSILFRKKDNPQKKDNPLPTHGLIDTHCHIDDEQYASDFDAFIQAQKEAGVEAILVPGVNIESLERVPNICARYPDYLFPAIGLHPEEVREDWSTTLDQLQTSLESTESTKSTKWIAIGEIGLDYHFDTTYKEEQKLAFRRQLDWALQLNLPAMIHSRDATEDMLLILKEYTAKGLRGVMHCFSGSHEVAEQIVKMGLYLGIGGVITFKNAKVAEHLQGIPLQRIVLETDAPWMAPTPYRGKRNEPAWMVYVAAKLAEVYNLPLETIIQETTKNARQLFFCH